jgi:hypothetical protein
VRTELGYNVMQSDLDILWMANPYPYLKTHFADYTLVFQVRARRESRWTHVPLALPSRGEVSGLAGVSTPIRVPCELAAMRTRWRASGF